MKILCREFSGDANQYKDWLTIGKIYHALEVTAEARGRLLVRIMSDKSNGVALFPLQQFEVVSNRLPDSWCINWDGDALTLGPDSWARIGFWEEFYDRDPKAVQIFECELKRTISADP